jgi:hypothetical protein
MAQFGQLTTCPCLLLLPLWKFCLPWRGRSKFPNVIFSWPWGPAPFYSGNFFWSPIQGKKAGPLHSMTRLLIEIGCIEILFLLLAATIFGMDYQPFLRPGAKHSVTSSVRRAGFGPDSAALRRIALFCRRIWLLDCRSYLNRKQIIHSSAPESMPVVSTKFYAWEVQNFESARSQQNKKSDSCRTTVWRTACRTVLRGFMQNHVGPKNVCKKTRKTCSGQSSLGCV